MSKIHEKEHFRKVMGVYSCFIHFLLNHLALEMYSLCNVNVLSQHADLNILFKPKGSRSVDYLSSPKSKLELLLLDINRTGGAQKKKTFYNKSHSKFESLNNLQSKVKSIF